MNVSAIIVTRGDVDLGDIVASLPSEWELLVWDNGARVVHGRPRSATLWMVEDDLSVYGRYAAIEYASHDLIYVQDDDCVVSDPELIVSEWLRVGRYPWDGRPAGDAWGNDPRDVLDHVVCNMPEAFRARHFYDDHSLVGFGAAFHRSAPQRVFDHFTHGHPWHPTEGEFFCRTCDIPFTFFSPCVLVDVEYVDMPWASADNRMWKQPDHQESRNRMLELCKEVRDAGH